MLTFNPDIVHRTERFGGVLFDLDTKDYVLLDRVGYALYAHLRSSPSAESAATALRTQAREDGYDLTYSIAETFASEFLFELAQHGVVSVEGHLADKQRVHARSLSARMLASTDRPLLRAPLVVSLNLIFTCNLLCQHCYVGSTGERKPDSMTADEAKQIVARLGDMGVFDLVLTGGEPTLFRGLFEVIAAAKEHDMYVCLNTNGTTSGNIGRARAIAASGVDCVKISIDSADQEVHDAFRGRKDAFSRTLRGIRALVDEGVKVDVHATLSSASMHKPEDVQQLLDLCRDLGCHQVHVGRVFATGRATQSLKQTEDEIANTLQDLRARKDSGDSFLGRLASPTRPKVTALPGYDGCGNCTRGVYSYIAYDTTVYPCTNLYKARWCIGNLRNHNYDLAEVWGPAPELEPLRIALRPAVSLAAAEYE